MDAAAKIRAFYEQGRLRMFFHAETLETEIESCFLCFFPGVQNLTVRQFGWHLSESDTPALIECMLKCFGLVQN